MVDRVVIPLPGVGTLVLDVEAYRMALADGAKLVATPVTAQVGATDESLLDAEQLAAELSLPATWIEQAARERRIPSIQAGRWRRFKRSAVERALSATCK